MLIYIFFKKFLQFIYYFDNKINNLILNYYLGNDGIHGIFKDEGLSFTQDGLLSIIKKYNIPSGKSILIFSNNTS